MSDENPVTPPEEDKRARDGETNGHDDRVPRDALEDAVHGIADDGQVEWIVEEQGRRIGLGQLVQRGTPVLYHFKLNGRAIPDSQGGLLDPYATTVPLVVDGVPEDVKVAYVRHPDRTVREVHVYMTIAARVVYQALSDAARVYLQELEAATA